MSSLLRARELSEQVMRNIRQNPSFAFIYHLRRVPWPRACRIRSLFRGPGLRDISEAKRSVALPLFASDV